MSPREFDSFMVKTRIGTSRSIRRLTPAERWCFIAGILAIAAESPVRGALLLAEDEPVTTDEIADQAGVSKAVAQSAITKLTRLGKLEHDNELGCLIVMTWHDHQPEPKPSDTREAWRTRKQKQRDKERDGHANVTRDISVTSRDSHAPEVEVEEKTPPSPRDRGSVVTFRRRRVPTTRVELAEQLLSSFNEHAGTRFSPYTGDGQPSDGLRRIIGAITDWPDKLTADYGDRVITNTLKRRWWGDDPPTVGVVFGPGVIERNMAAVDGNGVPQNLSSAELADRVNAAVRGTGS